MIRVTKIEPYVNEDMGEAIERSLNSINEENESWADLLNYNGQVYLITEVYPEVEPWAGGLNYPDEVEVEEGFI